MVNDSEMTSEKKVLAWTLAAAHIDFLASDLEDSKFNIDLVAGEYLRNVVAPHLRREAKRIGKSPKAKQ